MTVDLLPCPFCGGEPKARQYRVAEDAMGCTITCQSCFAASAEYEDAYAPIADAISAWNRRDFSPATIVSGVVAEVCRQAQENAAIPSLDPVEEQWRYRRKGSSTWSDWQRYSPTLHSYVDFEKERRILYAIHNEKEISDAGQ